MAEKNEQTSAHAADATEVSHPSDSAPATSENIDGDVDGTLSAIERELTALVNRCEQTTARHAEELEQRQAEIDRTLQIALKRQVEIDRQSAELRRLADEVVQAERELTHRRQTLAGRLKRRRARLTENLTASIDAHAKRAAEELEARAKELSNREAECNRAGAQAKAQLESARAEAERSREIRQLVEEQASLAAEHAKAMDDLISKREQSSLELVERLTDACGMADRVRDLSEQLREARLECRELRERADQFEQAQRGAGSELDAARARIARLESHVESINREKLLLEQRWTRHGEALEARETEVRRRERWIEEQSRRLREDQAACDKMVRDLGKTLGEHDRMERQRRLDPRTPLATTSMPLPASARRRPEVRLVHWKGKTT